AARCTGGGGRLREHDGGGHDPRPDTARRALVLAAGRRPPRVRRDRGAVGAHRGYGARSMSAAVELEQVVVKRSGRVILGPIDWRAGAGEHWALLGPNGAGKTTL